MYLGPAVRMTPVLRPVSDYVRLAQSDSTLVFKSQAPLLFTRGRRVSARISDLPLEGFCLHFPLLVMTGSQAL